ncbi:hypothetical protein [Persephonella sp.]
MRLSVWILFLLVFLASCSPKYKIEKVYYPPEDRVCVEKCDKDYTECTAKCLEKHKECLKDSADRAEKIYRKLRDEYERLLSRYYRNYDLYTREMEIYEKNLSSLRKELKFYSRLCSQYKDKEACSRREKTRKKLKHLEANRPQPPEKPRQVNFEEILEKERKACSCDCGCRDIYDACYQSCGGKVEIKKVCVENCD